MKYIVGMFEFDSKNLPNKIRTKFQPSIMFSYAGYFGNFTVLESMIFLYYPGIFYALAIVGPAIGYLAGGAFLNVYVDIDSTDLNRWVFF